MVPVTEPCVWFRAVEQQETNRSEFVYLVKMEIFMGHFASWRIKLQCAWGCWKPNPGAHCHRRYRWEPGGTHTQLWEPVVCAGHAIQFLQFWSKRVVFHNTPFKLCHRDLTPSSWQTAYHSALIIKLQGSTKRCEATDIFSSLFCGFFFLSSFFCVYSRLFIREGVV